MTNAPVLMLGDCLERMAEIADGSVDMVLCDLPYGTTACKWDSVIPFEPLWAHYWRLISGNGAIILFGSEPFSSALRLSAIDRFKYDWIWEKNKGANVMQAKNAPLKTHETISVFSRGAIAPTSPRQVPYFPQGLVSCERSVKSVMRTAGVHGNRETKQYTLTNTNYPRSILRHDAPTERYHPTQKPVALLEYLIRTYTQKGQTVLDNTMGSGSTGVACVNTGRKFIGIEREPAYYEIAQRRIRESQHAGPLFEAAE